MMWSLTITSGVFGSKLISTLVLAIEIADPILLV
jgi:hypothetical protein